jgi:hypothetical protein
MREIAEIELAIQGGTEKIETLGIRTPLSWTFILLTSGAQVSRARWTSP